MLGLSVSFFALDESRLEHIQGRALAGKI